MAVSRGEGAAERMCMEVLPEYHGGLGNGRCVAAMVALFVLSVFILTVPIVDKGERYSLFIALRSLYTNEKIS